MTGTRCRSMHTAIPDLAELHRYQLGNDHRRRGRHSKATAILPYGRDMPSRRVCGIRSTAPQRRPAKRRSTVSRSAPSEMKMLRPNALPMLYRAVAWKASAKLAATQVRVEHWFRGIPLPLIGLIDFVLLDGLGLDLKTTRACPSRPRA